MGWENWKCFSLIMKISEFQWDLRHEIVKIPTSLRDITDYIYLHLLPRNRVRSDLNGINYHTSILVQ